MDSLPSPAVSPDNSPNNSPSTPLSAGRKRARSSESQASSSKRALSEDPSAVEQPQTTTCSPTKPENENDEIDVYLREQGEHENQHAAFGAPAHSTGFAQQQETEPSPSEKLQLIKKLKEQSMVAGDTWYVISRSWYRRWEKACTGEVDKEGAILESQLGPVDNSPFFKDGKFDASLSMIEGVDVEFIPSEAWNAFTRWYGEPPHAIARQVITRGVSNEASLELRPLCFPVFRLATETSSAGKSPERYITISSQAKLADLYLRLLEILGLPPSARFRTWVILNVDAGGASITPSELAKNEGRLLPSDDRSVIRSLDEFVIQSNDGLIVEVNEDDAWLIDEATVQQSVSSQAQSSSTIAAAFSYSNLYSKLAEGVEQPSLHALGRSPSISTYGKGKVDRKGTVPGTIGFSNMGNTCFMNSALQCLAHTEELVEYFLTGVYHGELNPDNPLGMQGAIAEAFGAILNRVWLPQSSAPYAPREFKTQLQRFAPQFTGYQQHDSQELVAFLLDGLHEDLNRVLKKPYVEKPDWHGGGDKELVMLAKESWEGYMKRNDSVIVDLFQGQYKSTLICPECNKVSITFDPFMYLTLPLPVQKKWTHSILYIPWDASKPHVKVPVELNRNATFKELRQLLGNWMQSEPDTLLTLETFSNRFYKYLDDTVPVGDMSDADHIVCFELPCHAQQSRTWRADQDPTKNHVILPVHLCKEIPSSHSSFQRPSSGFAHPFLVVLDNEQVRDRQRIYTAVVERLERWTKHARDLYRWEGTAPEEVTIPETRPKSSLTEIKENGDIVAVEEEAPEEGDIADGKSLVLENDSTESMSGNEIDCLGPKPDLFEMHIQSGHDKLGTSSAWSAGKWERWETREKAKGGDECPPLLFEGDALYCEWDDNFRSYFFGDEPRYEHSLWTDTHWGEFIHPDFKEMREASKARIKKSITLEDCLKEFTKEEQLGEDDLWYCPQCKKHQQATKKFDVWTIPDVLVVHLKRFSNSRILRDKIDAFVDFPIEGLDLEAYSGERQVAKRIVQEGHDVEALGLSDIEEPLIYDLFAVDEHLGGLGGGHYRAYAKNHETKKWYHFDDTHVSTVQASDAVNQNAYLLFYKRRTSRPIGGKTREKIEAARQIFQSTEPEVKADFQLPTPPEDEGRIGRIALDYVLENSHRWLPLDSSRSPSREDVNAIEVENDLENGAPSFEGPQLEKDPFARATRAYDFPNPGSTIASPASSNAADMGDEDTPDMEFTDLEDDNTALDDSRGDDTGVEVPVSKTSLHDIDL